MQNAAVTAAMAVRIASATVAQMPSWHCHISLRCVLTGFTTVGAVNRLIGSMT